jgi:hypothetical protein
MVVVPDQMVAGKVAGDELWRPRNREFDGDGDVAHYGVNGGHGEV